MNQTPPDGQGESQPVIAPPQTTKTTPQFRQLLTRSYSLALRVGVKNCKVSSTKPGYVPGESLAKPYSLTVLQSLDYDHVLHLLDAFYNCPQPVWVWGDLSHIPNGTKKIDAFGGVL